METIEYHTTDKSGWGDGPWQGEPDKKQWLDPATGLPCLIVRNVHCTGSWCGYVGVRKGHPLYRRHYDYDGFSTHEAARRHRKFKQKMVYNRKYGKDPLHNGKYSVRYDWRDNLGIEVHGGLTFSGACHEGKEEGYGVCHVDESGDKVWWLGFDCSHYNDVAPMMNVTLQRIAPGHVEDGEYRDVAYVTAEVEKLAKQIRAIA